MQVCKRASVQILMKCRLHGDICAASRLVSASSQQLTAQVLPGRRTSDQGSMSAPDSPPLGHSQPATCRLGARPLLTPQNIAAVGACSAQSAPQHWLHGTKSARPKRPASAAKALPDTGALGRAASAGLLACARSSQRAPPRRAGARWRRPQSRPIGSSTRRCS